MSASRFLYTATPLAIMALAGMGLASAQSSSPFASKKKKQAWELAAPAPAPAPIPTTPQSAPSYPATSYPSTTYPAPTYPSATPPKSYPSTRPPAGSDYIYKTPSAPTTSQAPNFGSPYPPAGTVAKQTPPYAQTQRWGAPAAQPSTTQTYEGGRQSGAQSYPPAQNGYQPQQPYSQPQNQQPSGSPYASGPTSYPAPQQPRSWKERLGLSNIATVFRGKVNLGAAATHRDQPENQFGPDDGWNEDFIGDAEVEVEVSAITDGGLEYGVNLGGRAQYDPHRRGFGGRLADCPPTVAGCTGLRGHTSGFYAVGEDIAKDFQVQLESAHLFLRSAYGDVTLGRDDGAAYLFSLGAPTLLAVGASNSPVDYTGYDSVKTINDASGFASKVTYTSPRLLGDQIGVGVQLGVSYTPKADVCGVDYCVDRDVTGLVRPEIEDVFEAGLALDRTFDNGLSVEGTVTYANGSEKSGLAGLDDLQSYGAGLEFGYGDWTVGGSWLKSNNGLLDGDYTAYDAGVTWKPNALGFTLGYGHAEDENVGLTSDQVLFGATYEFEKFTLGTGVQYIDRDIQGVTGGVLTPLDQKATSVFIQGGFKF